MVLLGQTIATQGDDDTVDSGVYNSIYEILQVSKPNFPQTMTNSNVPRTEGVSWKWEVGCSIFLKAGKSWTNIED